jgi:hypothetical protein
MSTRGYLLASIVFFAKLFYATPHGSCLIAYIMRLPHLHLVCYTQLNHISSQLTEKSLCVLPL